MAHISPRSNFTPRQLVAWQWSDHLRAIDRGLTGTASGIVRLLATLNLLLRVTATAMVRDDLTRVRVRISDVALIGHDALGLRPGALVDHVRTGRVCLQLLLQADASIAVFFSSRLGMG